MRKGRGAGRAGRHRRLERLHRPAGEIAGAEHDRRLKGARDPGVDPPGALKPQALGHGRLPRPAPETFPALSGRVRVPLEPAAAQGDLPRPPPRDRPRAAARNVSRHRRRARLTRPEREAPRPESVRRSGKRPVHRTSGPFPPPRQPCGAVGAETAPDPGLWPRGLRHNILWRLGQGDKPSTRLSKARPTFRGGFLAPSLIA